MKIISWVAFVGLISTVLTGCGTEVTKPKVYDVEPLAVNIIENDKDMKGHNNDRLTIGIKGLIRSEGTTKTQRAATAIDVAYKAYESQKDVAAIYVYLYDNTLNNSGPVARAYLYPEKCGMQGKECDDIQWELYTSDRSPSKLEIETTVSWWHMRDKFQKDGLTDEYNLKAFIAKVLKITPEQVTLFTYDDYLNAETF